MLSASSKRNEAKASIMRLKADAKGSMLNTRSLDAGRLEAIRSGLVCKLTLSPVPLMVWIGLNSSQIQWEILYNLSLALT